MLSELSSSYHTFMEEQTGRDEYDCVLTVLEDKFLDDDRDKGCGGIVLYTENSRIVCPNTLINRMDLAFEEMLPQIRQTLFPGHWIKHIKIVAK